jgi:hypothetical protein
MARRARVVVEEEDIIPNRPEKVRPGVRRGVRVPRAPRPEGPPAREWVKPEGHTPTPLIDAQGRSEIHWAKPEPEPWPKDWPAYALDGPPSQTSR